MKICLIGKYPPIQGGVSRANLWATYALAQEGIDVHIVTNASEVEYQFRIFDSKYLDTTFNSKSLFENKHITIHSPSSSPEQIYYIPWANPFITKLATIATNVIKEYQCDLIYSYYLEPYAIAAYLASQWTGIPYGICTAGSDVGRLFQSHDLQTAYTKTILAADYVLTSQNLFRRFLHLGVNMERLYPLIPDSLPTEFFHPSASPLDVNQLLEDIKTNLPETYYQGIFHNFAKKAFDPSIPSIGIYGKMDQTKGSFDLLRALHQLRSDGVSFNLLALTQGFTHIVFEFMQAVKDSSLEEVTWLLPFLPPWSIPNFIKTCGVICFLERDFPIQIHSPIIPREVFACGTCLLLSQEIAHKWMYPEKLKHGSNALIVDPTNVDELAITLRRTIEEPNMHQKIGMNGYQEISVPLENFHIYAQKLATSLTTIQRDIQLRRSIMSIAEMQAYLGRLYIDESFRKLFSLEAETSLKDYKLTELEKQALKSIDKHMLDFFANSLLTTRRNNFQAAYPLLSQLVGDNFNLYFKRYHHLYLPKPNESLLSQVLSFGEFIEQSLASDKDVAPYASDLARYERICYSARFSPWPRDAFQHINNHTLPSSRSVDLNSYPSLHQGVQIVAFTYNIAEIARALQHHQEPTHAQEDQYYYVFQQIPDVLTAKIFAVSSTTQLLLSFCDGSQRVSDIVGFMERTLEKAPLADDILDIMHQLSSLHVIEA